jgi:hypothetical protein
MFVKLKIPKQRIQISGFLGEKKMEIRCSNTDVAFLLRNN